MDAAGCEIDPACALRRLTEHSHGSASGPGCSTRGGPVPGPAAQPAALVDDPLGPRGRGRRAPTGRLGAGRGGRLPLPSGRSASLARELQHRLGVDLAHPGLGDTEDVADLCQGQTFVVVEGEHRLLTIAHLADRLDQRLFGLFDLEGVHRAGRCCRAGSPPGSTGRTGRRLGTPRPSATTPTKEIFRNAVWNSASVISRSAATSASVGVRCRVASSFDVRLLDGPGLGPNRSRDPVDRAELVDDRALDPRDGVGLELDVPEGLEALDGVDQPDDPVAGQVGLVHVAGQPDRHPAGDVLDHRGVVDDELVAQACAPRSPCTRPTGVDAVPHRFSLRRQLSP